MKTRISFLFGAMMVTFMLHAQTNISTSISNNTTLTVANSPYLVTSSINVNSGVTLAVEEGVEIRFNAGVYLQIYGTLSARNAVFTANGSTAKGFWQGIYVDCEGTGTVSLENCTVEHAANIWVRKRIFTLKNSSINNFSQYGIQISGEATVNIENSTIKNTNYPIYFYGPGVLNPGNDVVLTGNTNDFIYLNFSDIPNVFHLKKMDVPYYNPYKRVTETGSLIIDPGVELKMVNSQINVSGKIKAIGTKDNPVIFDKAPTANDWRGLYLTGSSIDTACIFRNCIFRNAISGYWDTHSALMISHASPVLDSCRFTGNTRNMIITGQSYPQISNCTFAPSIEQREECFNISVDLNAGPVFINDSIQFNTKEIRAVKILEGTVVGDSRLKKISFIGLENISYCLYGNTTILDTASLTIDPGVVIKCRDNNSLITGNGKITGIGTSAEPIIFTHIADDSYGNPSDSQNNGLQGISASSSGRIFLYSTATSRLENWKILYAGYNQDNYAVHIARGNILQNCEIRNSYRGIRFSHDAQIISNSFNNINYYPLARLVNQGTPVLLENTVSNVGYIGILITGFENDYPLLKSLDFAGYTDVSYIIENITNITAGNVVSVDPGVVIKFASSGKLRVNGGFKAIGTADKKIVLTSLHDDSAGGDTNNNGTGSTPGNADWQGIDFTSTASDTENYLKNCEIRYVSREYWNDPRGAIRINSCRVVLDSAKVNFTNTCALAILGDANPEISNCQFYNLGDAPIYMDLFSNPVFSGNNKLANLPYTGIRIRGGGVNGTIPARNFAGYDTISYIIEEDMTVTNQLTIPAGLTFKGNGKWLIRGKLDIQGTAQKPVVFTTIEDDAYGNPKDMQQNGNTTPTNNGNFILFYDEANDNSLINFALFRYSNQVSVQLTNASPGIHNTLFQNSANEGIRLSGSSVPSIHNCTFNNIKFPFTTSLVTYPGSTSGNVITGTTGRAIRVTNETLTQDVTLLKRNFAGIDNIPYVFHNYTIGTGAILSISPGLVLKFMQDGYLRVQNGLLALGGSTPDSTIIFTSDRDDFYGGDTYGDGDANLASLNYWNGIYFYNESIDENCILKNCILKNGSYYYYWDHSGDLGAVTLNTASPTIQNCLFKDNYYGIVSINISQPAIINCDFVGSNPNDGYGIWNKTSANTITAVNCWWNSNTGPKHTSNPGGSGERVSDYVIFTPFAMQLAKPVLGDVSLNGTISPLDASLILQHSVSNIVLSANQQGVADVSGNGSITSFDASLILQYCVGLISRFDGGDKKSSPADGIAQVSFGDISVNEETGTFSIPVSLTTQSSVKSLEMKYGFDQQHIRFLKINTESVPSGISLATGYNPEKGEIALSLASAYDLELLDTKIGLEFELLESSIRQSTCSLVSVLANEYRLGGNPAFISILTENITSIVGNHPENIHPFIYYGNEAIHVKFALEKANQVAHIQLIDLSGRTIFRRVVKGLDSGYHSLEFPFSNPGGSETGVFIIKLHTDEFYYSGKLIIK